MIFDEVILDDMDEELTKEYWEELRLADEKTLEKNVDLRVLSLGAGVQSSFVLFKMLEEKIKPADIAIFADTGNEPKEVYDWLEKLIKLSKNKINIEIVKNKANTGNIVEDYKAETGRHSLIPTHIKNADGTSGFSRRTCTMEYKINPIQQKVRDMFGVKSLQGYVVEMVMGISKDEVQRAKRPPTKWQVSCYPLIENDIHRLHIENYMKKTDYGTPPRSACIICPFKDNKSWKHLKETSPEEFKQAIEFDDWLRDSTSKSNALDKFKKVSYEGAEQYLYRKKIPLKIANLDEPKDYQYTLFDDECEGMCGI